MDIQTETVETEDANAPKDIRRQGGDKRMAAIREAMDMLIGAVDVDNYDVNEYDVLGKIAVRAGLMWRCVNHRCRGINHNNCTSCDSCDQRRPRPRAEPKPEPYSI